MTDKKSEHLFSMAEDNARAKIIAMGIGGMGRNAMENIAMTEIDGLELYSVNTDMQDLAKCVGSQAVQIGAKRTEGKGAGGNCEVGRSSAEDDIDKLRKLIEGADLVFIAAGMGGGTGTGAAPIVANLCREMGILSIGIVTSPMFCEGAKRMKKAQLGLKELRKSIDSLMVIENEKLSLIMDKDDVSIIDIFKRADEVLLNGVNGIGKVINAHGYINLDMADLSNVLQRENDEVTRNAFIGIGISSGEDRALRAASIALDNPLLEISDIEGATKILINVTADENMGLNEAQSAVQGIVDEVGVSDPEVYMGFATDNKMGDKISITIIATGMGTGHVEKQMIYDRKPISHDSKAEFSEISDSMCKNESIEAFENDIITHSEDRAVFRDNDISPVTIEDFGTTVFVRSKDWQTPACVRRKSQYSDQDIVEVTEMKKGNDVRKEFTTLKRFKRKPRRTYGGSLLRLAC